MAAPEVLSQVSTTEALEEAQKKIAELERNKATGSQLQVLSRQITESTEAFNGGVDYFAAQVQQVNTAYSNTQKTLTDLNNTKADAQATSSALNLTNTALTNLRTDYTDQKRVSGTSKQTVTSKMQVLIPHGIPTNAVKPGSKRVPKLSWVTEAAAGFRSAIADDTNIVIDYDVALVTETDGWIMQWEL